MSQERFRIGLLHKQISHIFFVAENIKNPIRSPEIAVDGSSSRFVQLPGNAVCRDSLQEPAENIAYDDCLFFINNPLSVLALIISQHPPEVDLGLAFRHFPAERPFDILRDGMAFLLSHGTVECQEHFAVLIHGIDFLAFKVDTDRRTQPLKFMDAVQGVHGIPREA